MADDAPEDPLSGAVMNLLTRLVCLLLAVGSYSLIDSSSASAFEQLYVNTYGSDLGVWARGHCQLYGTVGKHRLEIEELSLEPNWNYQQSFSISGFRLAYSYRDKDTEEFVTDAGGAGPQMSRPLLLSANQKGLVKDLVLEVTRGRPPRSNEILLVELHIMISGGGYFTLVVRKIDDG